MRRLAFLPGPGRPAAARVALAVLLGVLGQSWAGGAHAGPVRDARQCLAQAMYWEARGEGRRGMVAVGWTILNRVKSPRFPATPCGVVHQGGERPPCQFSFWCDGKSDKPRDPTSWRSALDIAAQLLRRPPRDPTHGALYFHSAGVRTPPNHVRTARIGRQVFYR